MKKEEIEIGKWYRSENTNNYRKVTEILKDSINYKERIENGEYQRFSNEYADLYRLKGCSLEEISQYLPDGHPDKIVPEKLLINIL